MKKKNGRWVALAYIADLLLMRVLLNINKRLKHHKLSM